MVIENKTVILYITDNGRKLADRLKGFYSSAHVSKFQPDDIAVLWKEYRNLIFIMAAGIVVRTVAPLIKDKKSDPAIIVLDEKGQFAISLLSGHIGGANEIAKRIAAFLGGEAVITTSSDVNGMTPIDLWAEENDLIVDNPESFPHAVARIINNGAARVYREIDIPLPDDFLYVANPRYGDLLITNKKDVYLDRSVCADACACHVKDQLYLRPKNLVAGIGCNSGTSADEIEAAVRECLDKHNLSFSSLSMVATIDKKAREPGLVSFANKYNFEFKVFTPDELNSVEGITRSDAAFEATGAIGVSEPAALLAAGADRLLVEKQKTGNVTVAIAEKCRQRTEYRTQSTEDNTAQNTERGQGKLFIVGTGPGGTEHITPYACTAIKQSDVIVGYGTYIDLIHELIKDKEVISTGMTKEVDRCRKAVESALGGKTVSVISGGDPGIYAMAGLVFQILKGKTQTPDVEVIPGISALNACASRLGAPLMHDFAVISLSDRLTPWELIEKRLRAAAEADFVIVIYNPRSSGRQEQINKAREIVLKYRNPETPVGIVKAAMRDGEKIAVTDLKNMLDCDIDMQSTVIIGNSQTFVWNGRMVTPRGYDKKFEI